MLRHEGENGRKGSCLKTGQRNTVPVYKGQGGKNVHVSGNYKGIIC